MNNAEIREKIREWRHERYGMGTRTECADDIGVRYSVVQEFWNDVGFTSDADRIKIWRRNNKGTKKQCAEDLSLSLSQVTNWWERAAVKYWREDHPVGTERECSADLGIRLGLVRQIWDNDSIYLTNCQTDNVKREGESHLEYSVRLVNEKDRDRIALKKSIGESLAKSLDEYRQRNLSEKQTDNEDKKCEAALKDEWELLHEAIDTEADEDEEEYIRSQANLKDAWDLLREAIDREADEDEEEYIRSQIAEKRSKAACLLGIALIGSLATGLVVRKTLSKRRRRKDVSERKSQNKVKEENGNV